MSHFICFRVDICFGGVVLNSVPVSRTLASLDCKIDGGSCSDGGGGALAASDCCYSGYMPSLISPD